MNQPNIILLCRTRLALQSMHVMFYLQQLKVVVIPEDAEDMLENTRLLLKESGIPIISVNKKNLSKKITGLISKYEINLGFIISFSYKIPPAIYSLPGFGFYNVHPGPLPSYRGPDPVFWQIVNREKLAGVTIHKVDDDYDTGPVVMSEMILLDPADTHGMLTEKLSMLASKMLTTFLKLFSITSDIPERPQDETKARYYQRQGLAETIINWKVMDAAFIIALINACNPWNKGAITMLNQKIFRIVEAFHYPAVENINQPPGTILAVDEKGLHVTAKDNEIICARIFFTEEGFLPVPRLTSLDLKPFMQFTQISGTAY